MKTHYKKYSPIVIHLVFLTLVISILPLSLTGPFEPLSPMMPVTASTTISDASPDDFNEGNTSDVVVDEQGIALKTLNLSLVQEGWRGGPGREAYSPAKSPGFSASSNVAWGPEGIALQTLGSGWTEHPSAPFIRSNHECVWDPVHDVMYMLGGSPAGSAIFDTWSYDPASENWKQIANDGYPVRDFAAAWETSRNMVLVHGGATLVGGQANGYATTKEFNPATNKYSSMANAPMKLIEHVGVWDDAHNQFLAYGGTDYALPGPTNGIWAFNPDTNLWTKLGTGPSLGGAGGAWDPVHREMFVYGGVDENISGPNTTFGTLWSYDPGYNQWEQKSSGPLSSFCIEMVWDSTDKMIMAYGLARNGTIWGYDPSSDTWCPFFTTTGFPPNRWYTSLVWDESSEDAILFAGWDGSKAYNDVWTWKNPTVCPSGELESSTFDTAGPLKYTNISWNPVKVNPATGTDPIKIQIATSNSSTGPWNYLGPDGTPDTYYTMNGQGISAVHSRDRYLRYKLSLHTENTGVTPFLTNLTIGYCMSVGSGNYTSKIFVFGSNGNARMCVRWTSDGALTDEIKVKLRWSARADMYNATEWLAVTNGEPFNANLSRYLQYQVELYSTDPSSTPVLKKVVIEVDHPPVLKKGQVDQPEGIENTVFNYSVNYSDPDGDYPISALVYIDGVPYNMTTQDSTTKAGCRFVYATKLGLNNHTYFFSFSDGNFTVKFPSEETLSGPFVDLLPVADISANRTVILKNETVAFNASESVRPACGIKSYYFDFGDGSNSGEYGSPRINHVFKKSGSYQVSLTITDGHGHTSSNKVSVNITVRSRPSAILSSNIIIKAGQPAIIEGAASSDEDGHIDKYIFDFGDYSEKLETSNHNATHVYSSPGDYLVTLVVVDNDGLESAQATSVVTVEEKTVPGTVTKSGGSGDLVLYGVVAGIIAAIACAMAFALLRSRRKKIQPDPVVQDGNLPPPFP